MRQQILAIPVRSLCLRILLTGCAAVVSVAASADVYRWENEDGSVTFSQHPPPESNHKEVEKVVIKTYQRFHPRMRHGRLRCGSRAVPDIERGNKLDYLSRLRQWKASYERRVAVLASRTGSATELEEHRCLLSWTVAELAENQDTIQSYQKEASDLKRRYDTLSQQKARECPDNVGMLIGPEAAAWAKCDTPIRRELADIKRRLRDLEDISSP